MGFLTIGSGSMPEPMFFYVSVRKRHLAAQLGVLVFWKSST
jgi:hypothetical protein